MIDGVVNVSEEENEGHVGGSGVENDVWGGRRGVLVCFWMLGLLNNSCFVVMNAGAKMISAGGVGSIYLANVIPSLVVKVSVPLWGHRISYPPRVVAFVVLTVASLSIVGLSKDVDVQLMGVAVGSVAGAIGETSFLAYSSFFDGRTCLSAWSSGTGFAGIWGYFWLVFFTRWIGTSFKFCLLLANFLAVMYGFVFFVYLRPLRLSHAQYNIVPPNDGSSEDEEVEEAIEIVAKETASQRMLIVFRLWEFTIPLFVVYFAEYAMQSGTWAAIGFPVTDKSSRDSFYVDANWMYQVGVFFSRSSGFYIKIRKEQLWILPLLQFSLLTFFIFNGIHHFWWNEGLLSLAFVVGLIGGTVYVHAYILISEKVGRKRREFALGSASMADTIGIVLANVFGLVIQGCLYGVNGISDDGKPPAFRCGYKC